MQPSLKNAYIPVAREQRCFLYQTARAIGAKTIVEFGTSFGIASIYLAAAVRDNGGGRFIGTEQESNKIDAARRNLAEAGLETIAEIRAGDAMETLAPFAGPIDMVLLDGWKDLYLPVLCLLTPKLRPGAVVMADNIYTFRKGLKPYGSGEMVLRIGTQKATRAQATCRSGREVRSESHSCIRAPTARSASARPPSKPSFNPRCSHSTAAFRSNHQGNTLHAPACAVPKVAGLAGCALHTLI
jgi:predicted O-methyltransferase YrrM